MDNILGRPRLSLCMIVKNEIDCLQRCIDSVKDIVDEIVIVDTGSTDGTLDLVKKCASRMTRIAWTDDFSHARNISLDMATGDWILSMDADSCLQKESRSDLLHAIMTPDMLACHLVMRNHYEGGDCETFLCTPLFRRMDAVRYSGKVHEQVTPALQETMKSDPKWRCATLQQVIIEHYGYLRERTKLNKRARNIALLTKAVEADPSDIYRRFKLAQALGAETDIGYGHLAVALEALLLLRPREIQEQAFAHELMANGALRLAGRNEPQKALAVCSVAESIFGRHPVTSFVRALSFYLSGDRDKSLGSANEALSMAWPPGSFVCNPNWLREDLYLLISRIRQERGEPSRAIDTLRMAVAEFPDSRRVVHTLMRSGLEAKMPVVALQEGARWLNARGMDAECLLLCAEAAEMHGDASSAAKWRLLAGAAGNSVDSRPSH
jgi:tetratricopeptide (TPR) repeat protein